MTINLFFPVFRGCRLLSGCACSILKYIEIFKNVKNDYIYSYMKKRTSNV